MQTINVNYAKSYSTSSLSAEHLQEVISEGIYNQIILPIFGENNDRITNMKYIETKVIDGNVCFDFDLNSTLMFRITVGANAVNGNHTYGVAYNLIDSDSVVAFSVTASNLRCAYTKGTDVVNWTLSFNFNYLLLNSEIKVIWGINTYLNVAFDSVTVDSSTIPVVCSFGPTSYTICRLSSLVKGAITKADQPFDLDGKVIVEKNLFSESSKVVGVLDNIIKIHNTTLGTNNYNMTKQLVEIDGVKYRQISGAQWIEDRD